MTCSEQSVLKQNSKQLIKKMAAKTRYDLLAMLSYARSGHPGGSLSIVEILSVLYYGNVMKYDNDNISLPDRDRLIISKGHASPTLYVVLAELGYFPKEWLKSFDASGSNLPKHCDRFKTPGIEASTGALGQGISIAVGMALAEQLDMQNDYDIYCIVGDGECQTGELWEAVMSAAKYNLDKLKVIVDYNNLQIDGFTEDIMPLGDMRKIWEGFGWHVEQCDGHDVSDLCVAFDKISGIKGKPQVIIAKTVKGKGVSFMENNVNWHSDKINKDQAKQALEEAEKELDESCYPVAEFLEPKELNALKGGQKI